MPRNNVGIAVRRKPAGRATRTTTTSGENRYYCVAAEKFVVMLGFVAVAVACVIYVNLY